MSEQKSSHDDPIAHKIWLDSSRCRPTAQQHNLKQEKPAKTYLRFYYEGIPKMTTVQQRYQPDSGEDEDKVLIPEQEPDYNKIENVADNYRIEEPISRNEQIDNRNLPPPVGFKTL